MLWDHLLSQPSKISTFSAALKISDLMLQAFPLIFGPGNGGHGWTNVGAQNLTYLSFGALHIFACSYTMLNLCIIAVGAFIGFLLQPLQERHYKRATALAGGNSVPEARFYTSLYGIWLLPLGLFMAAWSSFAYVNFMVPVIGFTLFGIGFYQIITAILNYIVDGYGHCELSRSLSFPPHRN